MTDCAAVMVAADIRFPSQRANGVQIVKTSAAIAAAGVRTTMLVRRSDARGVDAILDLFGVARPDPLRVCRLPVFQRRGSHLLPRLAFLVQALAHGVLHLLRGGILFTRDLQLADVLVRLWSLRRRVCYEAHAVEALMYRERGLLYGTTERASERKAARLARRERRVWHRAGAFVTTTQGIRATFEEQYGKRSGVHVIPNGCDIPGDGEIPDACDVQADRVLYAGQLYPWKGVDVLVDAMAEVPGGRLVVLGGLEGEADLERVRRRAREVGVESRVDLRGTVPQVQVPLELRKAALVVVPFLRSAMTERHTSPIKAFEAMAAGRPIVCSDLPSSREFLRHEENALLVPPGDSHALAQAIQRLLTDRSLARALAERAFLDSQEFAWSRRGQRLRSVFEGLR